MSKNFEESKKEMLNNMKKYYSNKKQSNKDIPPLSYDELQSVSSSELSYKSKLKFKSKKFKKALKILNAFLYTTLGCTSGLYIANCVTQEISNKVQSNEVDKALDYYGGISNYLGTSGFSKAYSKFVTNDTKNIRVGVDATVNEKTEAQLALCVNYLNEMFDVINPNYHFNTIRVEKKEDCDIFIQVGDIKEEYQKMDNNVIAVTYDRKQKNFLSYFQIGSAKMIYNVNYIDDLTLFRISVMHEFEHVLLNNSDLTYNKEEKYTHYTVPFSVLSYWHVENINAYLNYKYLVYQPFKDYFSNENVNYAPIDLTPLIEKYGNANDALKGYIENEFVFYTPFDIAAYAARYGDLNNEQNKKDCTNLIIDAYEKCKYIFGENRDYFLQQTELNSKGYPVKFENCLYESETKLSKQTKNIDDEMEL